MGKVNNQNLITDYLDKGIIKKGDYQYLVDFYLKNSDKSLFTAKALNKMSDNPKLKEELGVKTDFESYIWVITTSYYSMFYAVNALFAKNNIKIDTSQGVHAITRITFQHFFIENNKLAKKLYNAYEEAQNDALDITQTHYPEKADKLFQDLKFEETKRSKFQYEITFEAMKKDAETSIKRASEFIEAIEQIIN